MGAYYEPSRTGTLRGLLIRRLSPYSSLPHVEDLRARISEGGTLVAWRPLSVDPWRMPDDPYEDMDVDESAMEDLGDFLSERLKSGPWTVLLIDYQSRPSDPGMQEQRSDWFAHGDDVFWLLDSDFCARKDLEMFLRVQMGLWSGAAIMLEGTTSAPTESTLPGATAVAVFSPVFDGQSFMWWTDHDVWPERASLGAIRRDASVRPRG